MFVRDGCGIMAGQCPDALPAEQLGDHSYFAYLVVDDADVYYPHVVSVGGEIIKPLVSEPWGCVIRDTNRGRSSNHDRARTGRWREAGPNIERALAGMHAEVDRPNGMEGGYVHGRGVVRDGRPDPAYGDQEVRRR
jgi:hypothetical protein